MTKGRVVSVNARNLRLAKRDLYNVYADEDVWKIERVAPSKYKEYKFTLVRKKAKKK